MTICERLRQLREQKGLNKKQLAVELGMPYTTYNNYETGQNDTGSHVLIKLAKYYGVSVDYLLGVEAPEKTVNPHEQALLESYRASDMRPAVDRLLGVEGDTQ